MLEDTISLLGQAMCISTSAWLAQPRIQKAGRDQQAIHTSILPNFVAPKQKPFTT